MKKIVFIKTLAWVMVVALCFWTGCVDFLDTQPYGTTTLNTLSQDIDGAETLLIAAYSNLDGYSLSAYPGWASSASNWVYGSIAGGDAYKGSDAGDQIDITWIEVHNKLTPTNPYLEGKWITYYSGVARANDAIKAFEALEGMNELRLKRIAEARFLRGFYHFELRKTFGKVPYINETIEDVRIGNDDDILPMIQADFLFAAEYLPTSQDKPGRITKRAAQAYFGITKMWEEDYATAKEYFDHVINSGQYKLNDTYHQNFNAEYRNSRESILEVQQSVQDGSVGTNGNSGDALNHPFGKGFCCGFHQPSQNLVNAFKTDPSGLPMLDSYNEVDVTNDDGLNSTDPFTPYSGTLDPRIDWTVGRRGLPYLDWGNHPGSNPGWIRDQYNAGPYSPKKNVVYESQLSEFAHSNWNSLNANNLKLLRYADLLLYAAEAEIELDHLEVALELVNQIRMRAANPDGWLHTYIDPDKPLLGFTNIPAANYFIKPYSSFPDKVYAIKAVRFERRLELGMEGHRLFDLVRWEVAAEEKNKYFETEKTKRAYLKDAYFQKNKNEVLPIPQKAIDLSYKGGKPTLSQNPGY